MGISVQAGWRVKAEPKGFYVNLLSPLMMDRKNIPKSTHMEEEQRFVHPQGREAMNDVQQAKPAFK